MTDVPADPGGGGPEPVAPSDPPVVRRSNYSPPPPGAEPPSFDDDALAEAMAAEVRPYTQPITLPKPPPAPSPAEAEVAPRPVAQPVVPQPVAPQPSPVPPESPVVESLDVPPPVAESWTGIPMASEAPAAPSPDVPTASAVSAEPAAGATQEELLRSLGGASTLEAIERLENQLRLISSGESGPIDLTQAPPSAPVAEPPAPEPPAPEPPAPEPHAPESHAPEPPAPEGAAGEPEPALDHPAPGHFFPAAFEPIAPLTPSVEATAETAAPDAVAGPQAPGLPEVDASLIDPAAAAELSATSGSESPWWSAADPVEGAWDIAAPEPLTAEPLTAEPSAAEPPIVSAPDEPQAGAIPAIPFSTEPPVGPESPDWLDAPPPSFEPPELVEPPAFPDAAPDADRAPLAPLSADDMAQLPKPLPTEQPKLEDRAELPPPPGYDDIPIMWGDVAAAPPPAVPTMVFPAAPAPPAAFEATGMQAATETSALDNNDDDVIDEIDRVSGTGAIPVSSAGTVDPLSPPSEPIATIRLAEGEPALVDKKAQLPSAVEIESAGPEPTALDMRAGRAARLFWLWFAANSSVLSLGLGAVLLGTGMSLRQAIVAALAGVAISFLPLGLGALAGKWSGQPTMIVSRATFGHAGNILPALLAIATRVLWGGVLLWLLATAVAQVLVGAGLDAGLGTTVWQLVGLVAGFVIATVIAVFGYGFVARLQLVLSILSALLIVGAAVLTYQHLNFTAALSVPDGSWILVISGAALVFSVVGLAWVHSSSDLARYQRPASYGGSSMLWATFGATLPPFALIAWGAMLAASDPRLAKGLTSNPLAAIATLLPAWYPAPLLAAAGLGLLSGVVVTMYSGGFALQALGVRARRSFATFVGAILALATAAALIFVVTDFASLLRDVVITVAVPVAAWAGIFAAEMMIRTRRFHAGSLLAPGGLYPQVRWLNVLALIVISGIGLGLVTSSIPGLGWEGFLYGLIRVGPHDLLASSDAGVFVALLLGILVPLIGGVPAIRRQERAPLPG